MPRIALYAGSFDPVTNGHLDVVRHAATLADRLVLAIGVHPGKAPLFPVKDRLAMLKQVCGPIGRKAGCKLSYTTFSGLVVKAAQKALAADPDRATAVAQKLFPPEEAALTAELIRRDAPFYSAEIAPARVESMNRFAQDMGLLSGPVPYDKVVARLS